MKNKTHSFFQLFTLTLLFTMCIFVSASAEDGSTDFASTAKQFFSEKQALQQAGTPHTEIFDGTDIAIPYAVQYPVLGNQKVDARIQEIATKLEEDMIAECIQTSDESDFFITYESYRTKGNIYSVVFLTGKRCGETEVSGVYPYLFDLKKETEIASTDIFDGAYAKKAAAYTADLLGQTTAYAEKLLPDFRERLGADKTSFASYALKDTSMIFYLNEETILQGGNGILSIEVPRKTFAEYFKIKKKVPPAPPKTKTAKQRNIDPKKPMVALTYDDGPGTATNRILDTLEKHGAVATFFDTGERISQYPKIAQREVALGCEVASHSYNHKDFKKMSAAQIKADVQRTDAAFQKAIGKKPTLFRPPYGNYNQTVQKNVPYPIIIWSVDTLDWKSRNADSVLKSIQKVGNLDGKVILMHGIYDSTAKATEKLVPDLIQKGYQLVTVSELIQYRLNETPVKGKVYKQNHF